MGQKKRAGRMSLLACICILCSGRVQADAVQEQIDRAGEKISELKESVSETDKAISAYEREQKELEQDIFQTQEKISRLSAQLDETRADISNTQDRITQAQETLRESKKEQKEKYAQMKQLVRFMYQNGTADMLECVLQAQSMPEALRRIRYFEEVAAYDQEKMDEYKAVIRSIKKAEADLLSDKEKQVQLEEKQQEKLEEIDSTLSGMKTRLGSRISQIQQSKELRQRYQQDLERQIAYEQELERQKAEEDSRRAEEIRRQEEQLERERRETQQGGSSSSGNSSGGSSNGSGNSSSGSSNGSGSSGNSNSSGNSSGSSGSTNGSSNSGGSAGSGNSSGSSGSTNSSSSSGSTAESRSNLELLSAIIYCEAGSQPYEGQIAVGSVIMNRVDSSSFPNSISGVIYQRGQFSPVASGRFARALADGSGRTCQAAARAVLNGARNVSCLYFRADNGLIDGIVIGDHVFY